MKEYYIHSESGQVGPLSFEQLKQHQIKRETLVWSEGMDDWQKAGSVAELGIIVKSVPPPVSLKQPPLPSIQKEQQYIPPSDYHEQPQSINTSRRKNIIMYVVLGIGLLIGISAFSGYKNTEARNHEIEMQNAEQARIARENRIREIKADLTISYQNLENAKRNFDDVSAFKLLRSATKRHEQITEANNIVVSWQNKVTALETELTQLSNQQ